MHLNPIFPGPWCMGGYGGQADGKHAGHVPELGVAARIHLYKSSLFQARDIQKVVGQPLQLGLLR